MTNEEQEKRMETEVTGKAATDMIATIIGTRGSGDPILDEYEERRTSDYATRCANLGIVGRSGHAPGSDVAAERGYVEAGRPDLLELYLPTKTFGPRYTSSGFKPVDDRLKGETYVRGIPDDAKVVIPTGDLQKIGFDHAKSVMDESHWKNVVKDGTYEKPSFSMLLHGRNAFQIKGENLDENSDLVIVTAPYKNKEEQTIEGGTATVWELAKRDGIPHYNLRDPEHARALDEFLKGLERQAGLFVDPIIIPPAPVVPLEPMDSVDVRVVKTAIDMAYNHPLNAASYIDATRVGSVDLQNRNQIRAVFDRVRDKMTAEGVSDGDFSKADLTPLNHELIRAALEASSSNPQTFLDFCSARTAHDIGDLSTVAERCEEVAAKMAEVATLPAIELGKTHTGERVRTPQ